MAKREKQPKWPDYDLVNIDDIVSFGTSLYLRKDRKALRIVFPTGQMCTFAPLDGIDVLESGQDWFF